MYNQNYADRVTYYVANSIIIATIVTWLSLSTPFDHSSNNRSYVDRLYYRPAEIFPVNLTNPQFWVRELPVLSLDVTPDSHPVKKASIIARPVTPKITDPILYHVNETIHLSQADKNCLVRNVFYESGTEPYAGKIAVAHVTWNRLKSGLWGNTICKVVHAPNQFSWTHEPAARHRAPEGPHWEASRQAVKDFVNGLRVSGLNRSMNFHAVHVRPEWARQDRRVAKIGGHMFYALN
jgi:hypothetical protein